MTHCQPRPPSSATVGHGLVHTYIPYPKGNAVTKPLLKKFYFMSPVHVVKVTTHNIEQAAEWCDGTIRTTESRRNPGRTDLYIDVPVPKGAALVMAFPGMFITKRIVISLENQIKVTYGVFRRDFFEKNYWAQPIEAVDACWTRLANEEIEETIIPGTAQTTTVMNIHVANPGDVGKALEAARKNLIQNKDKAEVNVINALNGETLITETEGPWEGLVEVQPLTPYQQRALITEDGVEEGVVPETANVGLPKLSDAFKHPSLRSTPEQQMALSDQLRDPFKLAGSSHDPMGNAGVAEAVIKDDIKAGLEATDAAVVLDNVPDVGPTVDGVIADFKTTQEVLADAAEKIDAEPDADILDVQSAADRQKELEEGDPHRP